MCYITEVSASAAATTLKAEAVEAVEAGMAEEEALFLGTALLAAVEEARRSSPG
jgi:hypothetical protein